MTHRITIVGLGVGEGLSLIRDSGSAWNLCAARHRGEVDASPPG